MANETNNWNKPMSEMTVKQKIASEILEGLVGNSRYIDMRSDFSANLYRDAIIDDVILLTDKLLNKLA